MQPGLRQRLAAPHRPRPSPPPLRPSAAIPHAPTPLRQTNSYDPRSHPSRQAPASLRDPPAAPGPAAAPHGPRRRGPRPAPATAPPGLNGHGGAGNGHVGPPTSQPQPQAQPHGSEAGPGGAGGSLPVASAPARGVLVTFTVPQYAVGATESLVVVRQAGWACVWVC